MENQRLLNNQLRTPKMEFKLRSNARYFNNDELLEDLKRVAKLLSKETVKSKEYERLGKFSCKPYRNRFGSWNQALKKAGLNIIRLERVPEQELFDNLEKIWLKLGRQPFYGEIKKPFSKYVVTVYSRRFGGWFKACEAFIRSKKGDREFVKFLRQKSTSKSRAISEKLRLQVFKKDCYVCVLCGQSPAIRKGIILHVDHIVPFSKGGDTSLANLRTLCEKCNLGRGNDTTV